MSTLRGTLESIALVDVLQLLQVNRKSGRLVVQMDNQTGTLFVQGGEVVHAETSQGGGEHAAFDILEWDHGSFELLPLTQKPPVSIRRSLHDLMMEGARTSDSRRRLRTVFPDLHRTPCPTLPEPALTQGLRIYPEDRKVLFHLDGFRTFLEVMTASGQSEVAVLQACHTLMEAGRLELLSPEVTLTVTAAKTSFFRRTAQLELPGSLLSRWQALKPYADKALAHVKLVWPQGTAIEPVQYNESLPPDTLSMPKELMQSFGLSEGMEIIARPQP